jgi:ADP-ribosyl-[dinitrogen reductase] hydrolase
MTGAEGEASKRDRARGALLGLACGDAVGTTVEFKRPGSFPPVTDMVGGGPFGLEAGQWTDDTSMALCLAESLVDRRLMDLEDQLRRYGLWYRTGYLSSNGRCFDIGNTTRSQLDRFGRTGEAIDPTPDQEAAANGSLMRLAPVPIAWHRDESRAIELAAESSRTTHPAERPVDCCRLMAAIVAAMIQGRTSDEVFGPDFWSSGTLHPEVQAIADGSYKEKEPPAVRGTGYCVDALEAALWAVHGASDFRDAILRATNLGDDADTTAAIAGQLAGARWGRAGIPEQWLNKLAMATRITSLADALYDLESASAEVLPTWRYDDAFHAWWAQPGVLAGEYPGTQTADPTKLALLLDAGIRTVIDLTTPQDKLRPYREQLLEMAKLRGLNVRHHAFPIPDVSVTNLGQYGEMVKLVRSEEAAGRSVFIHCWGGVGRTGTLVGCLLADGCGSCDDVLTAMQALRATTRKAERRAPETKDQEGIIARWIKEGS